MAYVGVDINIAARLCEAAPDGGVLISEAVRQRIGDSWQNDEAADARLRGVLSDLSIVLAQPGRRPDDRLIRRASGAGSPASR
jgi:class 3 adenylate cyclase